MNLQEVIVTSLRISSSVCWNIVSDFVQQHHHNIIGCLILERC